MITVVPATPEVIRQQYGDRPTPRMQAWVVKDEDKVLAVAGLAFRGHALELFSDIRPEMKRYPVTLVRVARAIMRRAQELNRPTFAIRDPDEPTSDALLRRLGFVETEQEGVYRWHS